MITQIYLCIYYRVIIDGKTYWKFSAKNGDQYRQGVYRSKSFDIETTSYALLVYIGNNDMIEARHIMLWLMHQRNRNGGYLTTQV